MPARARWVKILDVNPRVIARHTTPITCQVNQVATAIRDWFPNPNATVRDAVNALQRAMSIDGYIDGLCQLLNISVEPVAERADRDPPSDDTDDDGPSVAS